MTKIFKYPLPMGVLGSIVGWNPEVYLQLPLGTRILTALAQDNAPMIWAEVDSETERTEARRFYILNTGAVLPGGRLEYINTIQINEGRLIFHIYEDCS